MIIRLVKMTFQTEAVDSFLELFTAENEKIRHFPGCHHLELWQDETNPTVFFTHSHWDSLKALERYRHSPLFDEIWMKTKKGFAARPEAWSVSQRHLSS
ncbi:MAG TPA: antibiotic biosynthesis monooxygenase family protein [Chitinophagaceae bacterium]|jgi:quinol monooxygenase YgiN|nr:antibiotic biosynthesis monooxygenase family protein [Chitinophagaceae bacterium]